VPLYDQEHSAHEAAHSHSALSLLPNPPPPAAAVEERIAAWSMLPAENGEGVQVLRYENTQKYDAHWVSESAMKTCVTAVVLATAGMSCVDQHHASSQQRPRAVIWWLHRTRALAGFTTKTCPCICSRSCKVACTASIAVPRVGMLCCPVSAVDMYCVWAAAACAHTLHRTTSSTRMASATEATATQRC
jgi:hypothetical protein